MTAATTATTIPESERQDSTVAIGGSESFHANNVAFAEPVKDLDALRPPPKGRFYILDDMLECFPLDHLPIYLLPRPSRKRRLQPPRLHYGWPYPTERVIDVGTRKNFVFKKFCDDPLIMRYFINILPTQTRIQAITREDLGIQSCVPEIRRVYDPLPMHFFELTNNYRKGDYTPPKDDVEKIREFFEFEGPPRWYLGAEGMCMWDFYSLRGKH